MWLKVSCCLFSFLLANIYAADAQESNHKENISWEKARHAWAAWWITHPEASLMDYNVFLFRNSFEVEEIPDALIVHLSADSRYKLYVNGQFLTIGPAKGTPENWQYESLDIAPYVRRGKNVIGVQVYNFGEFLPVSLFSRKTAFILQSEGSYSDQLNTGSGNWLVSVDQGYRPNPVTSEMIQHYYVGPPADSLLADRMLWNWEFVTFDDAEWLKPKSLERGAGRGYAHGVSWHLVPRSIPLLSDSIESVGQVVRVTGLSGNKNVQMGKEPLKIPRASAVTLLLDQKYLTSGFPQLTLSGGKGSMVKVTYSEALYDRDLRKGNRNELAGKSIKGYYDVILPDGGTNRVFSPLWFRTFRFIQLDITTGNDPLEIVDFVNRIRLYPFQNKSVFKSNDPGLSQIFNIGWRTARQCATETYMDCPYWEQLQYFGDTRIQALVSLYMTGDDRLMKNAIEQGKNSRMSNGLLLSRAPSSQVQIIPPFSLIWIWMVHDYLMYRDDPQFVKQFLPVIRGILTWFEERIAENGMLGALDWFNFCDWAEGYQMGSPPGADRGHSALISLMYAHTLEKSSEIFAYFGDRETASSYLSTGEKIAAAVKAWCYDPERGLIAETPSKQQFSQHTNIFGILTSRFSKAEQAEVVRQLLHDSSLIQATIYFRFYLAEALFHAGEGDRYLDNLDPWVDMMNNGLSTWAEGDASERSDCHAWGASPNYHFFTVVCGIRPSAPGFKKILIAPNLGFLETLKAEVPHPNGMISIDLIRPAEDQLKGTIQLPEETEGVFRYRESTMNINQKFTVNIKR